MNNPKTLAIDIETYSDISLTEAGVYRYTDSDAFEILLFAYSADDADTEIIDLAQGEELPEFVKNWLLDDSVVKTAFNALIKAFGESEFETVNDAVSFIKNFDEPIFGFSFADECILFYGFPYSEDGETVRAYMELTAAMVKAAREQKRIKAKQVIEENEKYYMRSWLVRLGFGGKDAKDIRRILLQNLKGHTAFRTDADKQRWNDRRREKMESEREVQ